MKNFRQAISTKIGRYMVGIALIVLLLISDWMLNRPEPKTTRQIGASGMFDK